MRIKKGRIFFFFLLSGMGNLRVTHFTGPKLNKQVLGVSSSSALSAELDSPGFLQAASHLLQNCGFFFLFFTECSCLVVSKWFSLTASAWDLLHFVSELFWIVALCSDWSITLTGFIYNSSYADSASAQTHSLSGSCYRA